MSRIGWVVFAFIAGTVAVMALRKPDPPSYMAQPPVSAPGQPASAPRPAYALDTARSNWPPLDDAAPSDAAPKLDSVNYYIVLDGSGSMRTSQCSGGRTKIEAAVVALTSFTQSIR